MELSIAIMEKIEVLYERIGSYGVKISDGEAMKEIIRSVMILELGIRGNDFLMEMSKGNQIRVEVRDIVFNLIIIMARHGVCMECLSGDLEEMVRVKEGGG